MTKMVLTITPESFDPELHTLPTAGELLLAGAAVTITTDGVAFPTLAGQTPDGVVMDVSRRGEIVEIAAAGEKQADGGFYFAQICVMAEGE